MRTTSRAFSEQFFHWETALRFTVKNLMCGMRTHEIRATKTEFYFSELSIFPHSNSLIILFLLRFLLQLKICLSASEAGTELQMECCVEILKRSVGGNISSLEFFVKLDICSDICSNFEVLDNFLFWNTFELLN